MQKRGPSCVPWASPGGAARGSFEDADPELERAGADAKKKKSTRRSREGEGGVRSEMPKHLFLSHAWRSDAQGRSTHDRARELRNEIMRRGYVVWFDEDRMLLGSNLDLTMANGIIDAAAVCVCVTRAYCEKINRQEQSDACVKELRLAHALNKRILPLIMEPSMLDVTKWPNGVASMYLANMLYVDASGDDMRAIADDLCARLRMLGMHPASRHRALRTRYRTVIHI